MRSNGLGIESAKPSVEQHATAVRTRYPQLHRRPENVLTTSIFELAFLVLPFVLAIGGFWLPIGVAAQALAAGACVLLVISYVCMALATRINAWWFAIMALPVVALYDVVVLHYSMWQYEFSVVEWKGRNICVPAMRVIPRLPSISATPGSRAE